MDAGENCTDVHQISRCAAECSRLATSMACHVEHSCVALGLSLMFLRCGGHGHFCLFSGYLILPRNNSCLSCFCCSCQARRATCLVAAHGAALAACAALLRRPSTPFVAVRSLSSAAPSWREHCAEFERGRHAEPRGPLRHAERRVRTPCDSCGFLCFFLFQTVQTQQTDLLYSRMPF